jgi:hypothetical protein
MAQADIHGGVKIGDWLLIALAVVAGWLLWQWAAARSTPQLTSQFVAPNPSGTYTYGPTGLLNWNAIPLVPTPLPQTYIGVPNNGIPKGLIGNPIFGQWGGGSSSGVTYPTPVGGPILAPGGAL